jgi:hypothetical protein
VKASLNQKDINPTWYLCEKQWNRYSLGKIIPMPTSSYRYKHIYDYIIIIIIIIVVVVVLLIITK